MQETEIPNITQEVNEKDSQSNGDKFWDENFNQVQRENIITRTGR